MKKGLIKSKLSGVRKTTYLKPTLKIGVSTSTKNNSFGHQHNFNVTETTLIEAEHKKTAAITILNRYTLIR